MQENGLLAIFKQSGETPLQRLERLRVESPEYRDTTLSYAGRLDPLASGVMLVLVGDEANKNREQYLGLPKEYEVEVLFGVTTDTYDVLGLATTEPVKYENEIVEDLVNDVVRDVSNFNEMTYPPYSSKPVEGKSLFQWAREGRLGEISIPKQKGNITKIEILESRAVTSVHLFEQIISAIDSVKGDFRQEEIFNEWKVFFDIAGARDFLVMKFRISCESGTYMRSFSNHLGELIGTPALALTIHRTKVGEYTTK